MMKRAAACLVLLSGGMAAAQDVMRVTYSWVEVAAGTNSPVANPNGVLDPGEGARIEIQIEALHNGTNANGQETSYPGGGGVQPGVGAVRGICSFLYDLTSTGGGAGTWNSLAISPVLHVAAMGGIVAQSGETLRAISGGQFCLPGNTANATNPVAAAWRGVWNPASYEPRSVTFTAGAAIAGLPGQQNAIYVQRGTGYTDPTDPTTAYALYWCTYIGSDFGAGVTIPIGTSWGGSGSPTHPIAPFVGCYPNCDQSTVPPRLNVNDFQCFLNRFSTGEDWANCDRSSAPPVLNVNDFQCFLNAFATGCI